MDESHPNHSPARLKVWSLGLIWGLGVGGPVQTAPATKKPRFMMLTAKRTVTEQNLAIAFREPVDACKRA